MQIFEVVCNNNNNNSIAVMVKCTRVCITFNQAASLVVIPHVSGHPSMLQPSYVLI